MRELRTGPFLVAALLLVAARGAEAQTDLSVTAITQPVSGCALTSTENVTIRIFNFGATLPAGTTFNVSYVVNAGAPVTELLTLASPLTSNATLTYTFVTQANVSVPGTYTLDATCSIAGDVSPANDAFTGHVVANTAPSFGGFVSGGTNVCTAGDSGVLTLSGHTGSVVRWEFSTDGGATWIAIANSTTTQGWSNLTVPTRYRALVQNGACTPQYSSVAVITIGIVSASLTAPADVCPGSTGNAASVPDAGPGAAYSWAIANGTITSGAGTRAIVFAPTGAGAVGLTATVQGASGCLANGGATVPLRTSTASIQAPASACPGATDLSASVEPDLGAGAIYFWTISNGLITGGLGTRTITFQPTGSSPVALEALVAQASCLQDALVTIPVAACASPGAFHALPPCRAVDTRGPTGALGGPPLAPGETRVLPLFASACGIPANAAAVAVNLTVVPSADGALALGAGNQPVPATEFVPLAAGKVRALQSIVRLATDGTGTILAFNDSTGAVDVVLDVSGAFE